MPPPSDEITMTSDRPRRTSFTSSTFNSLLGRSNTTSGVNPFPGPITTAAAQDQRRRMSTSGTSPTQNPFSRRFSVSTNNSDTIAESAIDDEDGPSSNPATPFARRMSKAAEDVLNGTNALRKNLGSTSGTNGRAPYSSSSQAAKQASMTSKNRTASDTRRSGEAFNWSEQIRTRAESSVSSAGGRPSFSSTSPSGIDKIAPPAAIHGNAKSGSQSVPKQEPPPPQTLKERIYSKPDEIGERMLKGDYYYWMKENERILRIFNDGTRHLRIHIYFWAKRKKWAVFGIIHHDIEVRLTKTKQNKMNQRMNKRTMTF